ncbi:hypothetical protein BP00DRAFT_458436 [Aspergillus indologenus CBS 114.80]|uniref:Fungal-type protein kinase domain-containing protein n=1 Tax=Aspergillus indologenus CBS 114.80 TaxID=1450541 RepID=A0A2V5IM96_9EURO|nr:hypothetical protein BP00DRAFT_458436 [Aspergillus indologenus CBS 114.80]
MPYPSDTQLRTAPPIEGGLDAFARGFKTSCDSLGIARPFDPATLEQHKDFKDLLINFVFALQNLPATSHLPATLGPGTFRNDLRRFISVVDSEEFEIQRILPLLNAVLDAEADEIVWRKAYAVVVEPTPPPRPLPFVGQTPYLHTISSFVNSSEYRRYVDTVLKGELGSIYIDVQNFAEVFLGDINGVEATSAMIMRRCTEGDEPLYHTSSGWRDWPQSTQEKEVLLWLTRTVNLFREYLGESDLDHGSFEDRTILAQPSQPLQGSIASRKLDAAIVRHKQTQPQQRMHWSQVLVPGELKSNPDLDTISKTWCDLGRYVREVFTAQESRRYVLGFTLCGSIMRLWEFDRAGAIASEPFDIHQDALKFVSTFVGYLMMNDKQLGYDPSIKASPDNTRFIEITRNGNPERLILDELMKRSSCVAGRATTCWKAHREGSEGKEVLVVKESWQFPERDEEGALLKEALDRKVTNIARYYFHETVYFDGDPDDTRAGIRRGIDLSKAKFHQERSNTSTAQAGRKRSSTHLSSDAALPSTKRSCSNSRSNTGCSTIVQNRVHRRVIVQDYGKPLHKATSLSAMLAAMEGCLQGYQSLYTKTGLLHGDISIGNLLMNEKNGFLIDLDLAIREKRDRPSGAHGKTGTRAFMPIGQLLGDALSFVHGLESFFWVLFWICIHYNGPNDPGRVVKEFDEWNYISMEDLAKLKLGTVSDDDIFETTMAKFTEYHQPLKRWVGEWRRVIFPNGKIRRSDDQGLLSQMILILQDAQEALKPV